MTLTATCEVVVDDYHAFNKMERSRKRWRVWIPILVFEAMVLAGALAAREPAALVFLLPFPAFWALMVVLVRWRVAWIVARTPNAVGKVEWRFDEVEFHVTDASGELRHKWSVFTGLEEGPSLFALRQSPYFARFIPRRAFATPEAEAEFVALVRRKLAVSKS